NRIDPNTSGAGAPWLFAGQRAWQRAVKGIQRRRGLQVITAPASGIRPTRSADNGTAGGRRIPENQFSPAGKVVYGQPIMKRSLHQTATPQHGLAAGAAALLAGWGWRFLPVFAVLCDERHHCDRRVVRRWRVAPVNPRPST